MFEIMKKKVYSQPKTDVAEMYGTNLMLNVSINQNGTGEVHAPERRGTSIPY